MPAIFPFATPPFVERSCARSCLLSVTRSLALLFFQYFLCARKSCEFSEALPDGAHPRANDERGARRAGFRALAAIDRWYRREARAALEEAVREEAPPLGVQPARLAVRDTTSRFGSCSTTGTISFSWRLIMAPPEVLDYVVVHELCHLREANHGAGFWRLVEDARPGWRAQRDWLHEHGRELLAYAPVLA